MTESTHATGSPIAIMGVPFDNVTTQGALALINQMILSRQPHYLVTANVDFVVQAQSDLELRRILFDAHLVVADGMPLVWASRWLGNPLPERVTGSGITPLLLAEAAARGWRVFFLGGTEKSVAQAAANTRAKHPNLQLVGSYSPPFKPLIEMDHREILRQIQDSNPDILLVAFGCPKQEKWLNMHYRDAGAPVAIGVGATIDFLAGTMKRAPLWMQKTGLEWIYRLLQEPRRLFHRYVTDLWVFGWAILQQLREMRSTRRARSADTRMSTIPQQEGVAVLVKVPDVLNAETVRTNASAWQQLPNRSADLLLDLARLEFIDSTGIGALIRMQKSMREAGKQLVLVGPNQVLERALHLMKLSEFFTSTPDVPTALNLIAGRRQECNVVVDLASAVDSQPLVWQGEITAVNAGGVAQATEAHIASALGSVKVDLSAVRFIDSSGVGLMVKLRKQALRENIELAFVGASENVRSVVRLLRLEEFLLQPKP
jgi:N-acetylglucosaminyldiphosphoundecaprenol N-acetyl-beta-D-mannosaminyltransferase